MNFVRIMTGASEMKPLPVHYGFSLRVPDGTILNCPHRVGKMNCPHRVGRIGRHRQITHLARNAFTIHYVPLGLESSAPRESRRQRRLPASVGTLSVRVSSFTTVMSRTVPSAWRTAWTRSTTWRICERSPSTFVPEAWVSMIRPDCLSSSCARWTSRRTETPAPIGIAWISAVAFMGLEVKGLTWYRAALTAAYHASVRPPRDRCDRTRPVPHTRLIDPIGGINLVRLVSIHGVTTNAEPVPCTE